MVPEADPPTETRRCPRLRRSDLQAAAELAKELHAWAAGTAEEIPSVDPA